jgi:hypothetical protein
MRVFDETSQMVCKTNQIDLVCHNIGNEVQRELTRIHELKSTQMLVSN